jgi:hypothetical protein
MQSKFISASKTVTRMLSEGRITDLANYIKLGNSIENMFLMTVADELAKNGVSINMLASKGSIVSLEALLKKLESDSLSKNRDRNLLKHYGFVLERAVQLWKDNRLENMCPSLERDLDERAVNHLMRLWNNKSGSSRNSFLSYVDNCIVRHVDVFTNAIKSGTANAKVSNDQLLYYTNHLENELMEVWERSPDNFKEIKAHLTGVLKDKILEQAKAGKLGEVLQKDVLKKFRETLVSHITIVDDLARYPALNEKFKTLYIATQGGQIRKDVTFEAIDLLMSHYTQFDAKVMADVNTLFRDEVIPFIIENTRIPIDLRRAAVNSVILDRRNNAINLFIGNYVTALLNSTISAKVSDDIRNDQGSFKGVVEQIIRQSVFAFKHNVADICTIMPDTQDLFADIHSVMSRLEASADVHKASDTRFRQLEVSMVELIQAYNQLKAENAAPAPVATPAASAPPAAAVLATAASAQGGRGLMGFFDRAPAPAEPTSKVSPPQSQFTKL